MSSNTMANTEQESKMAEVTSFSSDTEKILSAISELKTQITALGAKDKHMAPRPIVLQGKSYIWDPKTNICYTEEDGKQGEEVGHLDVTKKSALPLEKARVVAEAIQALKDARRTLALKRESLATLESWKQQFSVAYPLILAAMGGGLAAALVFSIADKL